jgi:glycosyltransferase involved in cell wall biosynthesis
MRFVRPGIVITTCDRTPAILNRAVKTALSQELPAEVIVVNDGLKGVSGSWDGVTVVKTGGRKGLAAARNVGLNAMSLAVNAVCYLDDDDELLPCHTRLLSSAIASGHAFAFSRAVFRHREFETEDPEPQNPGPKRYYDPSALLDQNVAPVSSFMHDRVSAAQIGGWDERILRLEDWDFWGRLFLRFGPPAKVNAVTNVIHKDGEGPNLTDSSRLNYSLMCSWRDVVADRLKFMASKGICGLHGEDEAKLHVPLIGVVMPVFNAQKYLRMALNSLVSQHCRDFEVLAVNDGSTDSSGNILGEYAARDKRIRVFNMPCNSGVTKALNYGLLVSRSKYVARMDADDVCLPDRLRKQLAFMDDNRDVDILGTCFDSMNEDLSRVNWHNELPTSPEQVAETMPSRCCIGHPTVMMRRRVVESIGGYDESPECRAVEDYELWLRALSKGMRIANLPEFLLQHREHEGQVSSSLAEAQKANRERLRARYNPRARGTER